MESSNGGVELSEGLTLGGFRLVRLLGVGGMGQVWEAVELEYPRSVALKFVRSDRLSPRALEDFVREAKAGGRLAHPGIVRVYGTGVTDGVHWISQELIQCGRNLGDFLEEARRAELLPQGYYQGIAELVAQIADALQVAHNADVYHRDIKPQNILMDELGKPRLTDFGLAKLGDDSNPSESGRVLGTVHYMSPEQVRAREVKVDHRTDIFSLGVVLYELLSLQRPFEGDSVAQITQRILHSEPADLRRLRSQMPQDLAVIAAKALEKNPGARYQTASDLCADLRAYLAHRPIAARPPSPLQRGTKWARRHPVLSVSGAIAMTALIAVSAVLGQLSLRNEELGEAVVEKDRINGELKETVGELVAEREVTEAQRGVLTSRNAELTLAKTDLEAERDRLETIVQFQEGIFQGVSPGELGDGLRLKILDGYRRRLERDGLDGAEVDERAGEFNQALMSVGLTTVASEVLAQHVLAPARERLNSDQGLDDDVRVRIESSVGSALFALGLIEDALDLLRPSLQRRRLLEPQTTRGSLSLGINVAYLTIQTGDAVRAAAELEELLALMDQEGVNEPDLRVRAALMLHFAYVNLGQYSDASKELDWILEFQTTCPELAFEAMAEVQRAQAQEWLRLGRSDDAIELLEGLLGSGVELPGGTRISIVALLATSLQKAGRFSEALPLFEEVLAVRRRDQGNSHPETVGAVVSLGVIRSLLGEFEEAESLYLEALALETAARGKQSEAASVVVSNLGVLYRQLGQSDKAVAMAQEAVRIKRAHFEPGNESVITGLGNLGRALREAGRYEDALNVTSEAHELALSHQGPTSSLRLLLLTDLARCYYFLEDLKEAETLFRQVNTLCQEHLGARHLDTVHSSYDLGSVLMKQERFDEAMSIYEQQLLDCQTIWSDDDPMRKRFEDKVEACRSAIVE